MLEVLLFWSLRETMREFSLKMLSMFINLIFTILQLWGTSLKQL